MGGHLPDKEGCAGGDAQADEIVDQQDLKRALPACEPFDKDNLSAQRHSCPQCKQRAQLQRVAARAGEDHGP